MLQVTRKDSRESLENMIRRFNRKIQQSGVLSDVRSSLNFQKPISRKERRRKAILRSQRKEEKARRIRLGLK